jgi:hypothetical protein
MISGVAADLLKENSKITHIRYQFLSPESLSSPW